MVTEDSLIMFSATFLLRDSGYFVIKCLAFYLSNTNFSSKFSDKTLKSQMVKSLALVCFWYCLYEDSSPTAPRLLASWLPQSGRCETLPPLWRGPWTSPFLE